MERDELECAWLGARRRCVGVGGVGQRPVCGGGAASYVEEWNGSSWSALGLGMDGCVGALAASGIDLFVGGWFTTAGGNPARSIARWDGSNWSALDTGISGPDDEEYYGGSVSDLAVLGNDLYAGGKFTTAGRVSADNIAKWNGSSWSA